MLINESLREREKSFLNNYQTKIKQTESNEGVYAEIHWWYNNDEGSRINYPMNKRKYGNVLCNIVYIWSEEQK